MSSVEYVQLSQTLHSAEQTLGEMLRSCLPLMSPSLRSVTHRWRSESLTLALLEEPGANQTIMRMSSDTCECSLEAGSGALGSETVDVLYKTIQMLVFRVGQLQRLVKVRK